mmetsp:Transcript_12834/g.22490  ORF Transcript_12834/g.22490 Transcript_12834/m.22490 type:complete len:289 (+) Transcript_12834:72-938(+)
MTLLCVKLIFYNLQLGNSAGLAGHAPGRHRNQFFRSHGVDGHAVVKIGLVCTHLQGHGKTLQHLVTAHADKVDTDDLLICPGSDQFILADRLVTHQALIVRAVPQVHEATVVHLDVVRAILGDGLVLGEAAHTNGRVGEHHRGHRVVVHVRIRHTAEQSVGESACGGDGHGRELHVAAHIPQGINVAGRGVLVLVHHNETRSLGLHAHRGEVQAGSERMTSGGRQQHVETSQGLAVFEMHGEGAVRLFGHLLRGGATYNLETGFLHSVIQMGADHRVKSAESLVMAHQ